MTHIVSVVYPTGSKFDMDYYLATHMPLVKKIWGPIGLKSWKVASYDSPDAPYSVHAWLEWESSDHAAKATGSPDSAPVFEDIAKFCDQKPILLSGALTGSDSW